VRPGIGRWMRSWSARWPSPSSRPTAASGSGASGWGR